MFEKNDVSMQSLLWFCFSGKGIIKLCKQFQVGVIPVHFYQQRKYGTHQLQLKRDTRGIRKGHACYTRLFLVIYTQLHAM